MPYALISLHRFELFHSTCERHAHRWAVSDLSEKILERPKGTAHENVVESEELLGDVRVRETLLIDDIDLCERPRHTLAQLVTRV